MPLLILMNAICVCLLLDLDMKKDIDTLIAEERTEIISKYDKVSLCTGIPSPDDDYSHIFIIIRNNAQNQQPVMAQLEPQLSIFLQFLSDRFQPLPKVRRRWRNTTAHESSYMVQFTCDSLEHNISSQKGSNGAST